MSEVYQLEPGEEVNCYYCIKARNYTNYKRGEAYLAGADHSPCDGNSNYICARHLDEDAEIWPPEVCRWRGEPLEQRNRGPNSEAPRHSRPSASRPRHHYRTKGLNMPDECKHEKILPKFDEVEARKMTALEIRRKYPRFYGRCPDCNFEGVLYASYAHYIFGDY